MDEPFVAVGGSAAVEYSLWFEHTVAVFESSTSDCTAVVVKTKVVAQTMVAVQMWLWL